MLYGRIFRHAMKLSFKGVNIGRWAVEAVGSVVTFHCRWNSCKSYSYAF